MEGWNLDWLRDEHIRWAFYASVCLVALVGAVFLSHRYAMSEYAKGMAKGITLGKHSLYRELDARIDEAFERGYRRGSKVTWLHVVAADGRLYINGNPQGIEGSQPTKAMGGWFRATPKGFRVQDFFQTPEPMSHKRILKKYYEREREVENSHGQTAYPPGGTDPGSTEIP